MSLTERLLVELDRLGSASHPIARTLPEIVKASQRFQRWRTATVALIALLVGFVGCYAWTGVKLEVLASNVEAWRQIADTEYRTHHKVVNVTEGQARGIVGAIERRKEAASE